MKDNALYRILDLVEEIQKVEKMIEIHSDSDSSLMISQYKSQKLKLTNLLVKELLQNSDNSSKVIYLLKLFIDKFYKREISAYNSASDEISFKRIEEAFL
ncbi:hypothetical protein [Desertivirga xinjiangensis]|uniref:hypothetical protein n=1 Tax=Desertivirga xinjiangensis TaxID=539206 RepID=UPI00210C2F02|nr:hypothetical protein [Pedobacter xinjiangensis]